MILKELRALGGAIMGGLSGAGFFAGTAAAAGTIGSSVLSTLGYSGYVVSESAKMGLLGGGIIGGGVGLMMGGLTAMGIFRGENPDNHNLTMLNIARSYLESMIIAGILGQGLTDGMGLGETAATFFTGGFITMLPASVVTNYIALPIVLRAKLFLEDDPSPPLIAQLGPLP